MVQCLLFLVGESRSFHRIFWKLGSFSRRLSFRLRYHLEGQALLVLEMPAGLADGAERVWSAFDTCQQQLCPDSPR